jgi:hypothetical protein
MAKEIITIGGDGSVNSEFDGFKGKACLKVAAEISKELERLGIVTDVAGISMKDTTEVVSETQTTKLKVAEG